LNVFADESTAIQIPVIHAGDLFTMEPSTVERWRAHLQIAAVTGMFIQCFVLVSLLAWRVPEAFFSTAGFRGCVILAVAVAILSARQFADSTFKAAVMSGYAQLSGIDRRTISISSDCPQRLWVVLHVRLNRNRFDRTEW
jgi:hypothetical protein